MSEALLDSGYYIAIVNQYLTVKLHMVGRKADREGRKADREAGRQTDRQTDRQTQTDRASTAYTCTSQVMNAKESATNSRTFLRLLLRLLLLWRWRRLLLLSLHIGEIREKMKQYYTTVIRSTVLYIYIYYRWMRACIQYITTHTRN